MRCSLYIHLPFCRSKCRYCDFYSVAGQETLIDGYLAAVAREWDLRTAGQDIALTSVFIGGGTPSLLSAVQWSRFDALLLGRLPLAPDAEWTVECNPDSFSDEKALLYAGTGVNRLTFGVQSMADRELKTAGRPHTPRCVSSVLGSDVLSRFRSVGVDIMYGLPGQTARSFAATLRLLLDRPVVKHLSAYELTIARGTPFGRHRSLLPLPPEEEVSAMMDILLDMTKKRGFSHYEISNFAPTGFGCRHNIGYWTHEPYLGIGCAAHSYMPPRRSWNVADITGYCKSIEAGRLPVEREEELTGETVAREMLFLGFRRLDGICESHFEEKTGMRFRERVPVDRLERFAANGFLEHSPPLWKPTEKGLLFADYMARELF